MRLVLRLWRRTWQSVAFDTALGKAQVRWLRRPPKKSAGWAHKHGKQWYAVWSDGHELFFQVDGSRWPMTEALTCSNVRLGEKRKFQVQQDGKVVREVVYDALDRDNDPSFDDVELEQEDFFVWAARLWRDPRWRSEAVSNWGHVP